MPNPVLILVPYLRIESDLVIGPWRLCPTLSFNGPWASDGFEHRSRQLMGRLGGPNGEPLEWLTLVVTAADGANGLPPSNAELTALQLALDFSGVSKNPEWSLESTDAFAHGVVTTDNTEIYCWPLDIDGGFIAFDTGLLNQTLHGGWNLDRDGRLIPCPIEVVIPNQSSIDLEVANALYGVILPSNGEGGALNKSLSTALRWWSKAWRNSPSVRWEDRIVLLKTAFEALLGESKSWKAANLLESRLRRIARDAQIESADIDHLLWSTLESARLERRWREGNAERSETVTDLVHWFCAFGDARNTIIHEGRIPNGLEYSEPGSPYSGPLFHSADRVFRESVKLILQDFGYLGLWRTDWGRLTDQVAEAIAQEQVEDGQN